MDFAVSHTAIEILLEHFVSAALGLTLEARVRDASELPADHRCCLSDSERDPRVWVAWHTNSGLLSACAAYDYEQAKRVRAHVLLIEWCDETGGHHSLWCYCDPKRPTEWTIGRGRHGAAP